MAFDSRIAGHIAQISRFDPIFVTIKLANIEVKLKFNRQAREQQAVPLA
jgi:hypothetical protein